MEASFGGCTESASSEDRNIASSDNSNNSAVSNDLVVQYGENWANNLSESESAAVRSYTDTGYSNINSTLRGLSDGFNPGMKETAISLHGALARAETPCDDTVFRGASSDALGQYASLPDDALVGKVIQDKGFMSTSLDSDRAFSGNVQFVIDVPKGSHGVYVGSISSFSGEKEVLFDAGQIMKVLDVSRDGYGRRIVHVRLL